MCLEVDRDDIVTCCSSKPHAGMDMLTVLGRQFHAAQQLVRVRASRNPNDIIEREMTFGERHRRCRSPASAARGHSSSPSPGPSLVYTGRQCRAARNGAWDPYPVHPAEPVPLHAGRHPGAGHHDEPEPAGHEGPAARRARLRRQPPRRIGNSGAGPEAEFAGEKRLATSKISCGDAARSGPRRASPHGSGLRA